MKRTAVRRKRKGDPRRGTVRDPKYLDWIRGRRCVVPGCRLNDRVEAAHVGARGLSQKSSDHETIPLCGYHHRYGEVAHHVLGKHFWARHGLDRSEVIMGLRSKYLLEAGIQDDDSARTV